MNNIVITGALGRDLTLEYSPGGVAKASGSIAVKRTFSKEGFQDTDWMNLKILGKRAETMTEYLQKGSKILVQGSFQIDQYEKDGEKKSFPYLLVSNFEFLDSKKKEEGNGIPKSEFQAVEDDDDSIPF